MSSEELEGAREESANADVEKRLAYLEGHAAARKDSRGTNIPLLAAVIAAAAGLIGQAWVAFHNANANRQLEDDKFVFQQAIERQRLQQQLLLNAVQADIDQAKDNLEFLIDTGLLQDSQTIDTAEILKQLEEGSTLSIAAAPVLQVAPHEYQPTADPRHCDTHLEWGYPSRGEHIICRRGFALSYNEDRKVPDWVSYRLEATQLVSAPRPRFRFQIDPMLPESVRYDPDIFREPVFDRGHLVPSTDMRWDVDSEREAQFISNTTPQFPKFNRGVWLRLEQAIRDWAQERQVLFIIAGPVFEGGEVRRLGGVVAIPDQFFKVVFDPTSNEAMAFLIPHEESGPASSDLGEFLVPIREIEQLTNLDLLSELEDGLEARLEGTPAPGLW